jgi:hypothetical protein
MHDCLQIELQIGGIREAVRLQFEPLRTMSPELNVDRQFDTDDVVAVEVPH